MNDLALQVSDLSLTLTGKKILESLSFQVERGEYISIVGPNGAGKTSLIKCISRIYSKWSGSILLNGTEVLKMAPRALACQLSYVPQSEGRLLPFTVFEFVLMGRYPHLSPFTSVRVSDKEKAYEVLEQTGLLALAERSMNTLSGGERQMVFVAAALVQGAEIILLDEPTTFLDYRHQAMVLNLLTRLHAEKKITILAASHDINTACAQSTRILALKEGSVLFYESPVKMMDRARLESLYGTPFLVENHPTGVGKMAIVEGAR